MIHTPLYLLIPCCLCLLIVGFYLRFLRDYSAFSVPAGRLAHRSRLSPWKRIIKALSILIICLGRTFLSVLPPKFRNLFLLSADSHHYRCSYNVEPSVDHYLKSIPMIQNLSRSQLGDCFLKVSYRLAPNAYSLKWQWLKYSFLSLPLSVFIGYHSGGMLSNCFFHILPHRQIFSVSLPDHCKCYLIFTVH